MSSILLGRRCPAPLNGVDIPAVGLPSSPRSPPTAMIGLHEISQLMSRGRCNTSCSIFNVDHRWRVKQDHLHIRIWLESTVVRLSCSRLTDKSGRQVYHRLHAQPRPRARRCVGVSIPQEKIFITTKATERWLKISHKPLCSAIGIRFHRHTDRSSGNVSKSRYP